MRILSLTILMFFVLLSNVMATSNSGIIRDLAIETMRNYAKELNDRGNYEESQNVMAKIRQIDREDTKASRGEKKIVSSRPIEISAVVSDPNADLKQAIAREDRVLSELNRDVDMLRNQIQATHHE